jgi:hypothetical protein
MALGSDPSVALTTIEGQRLMMARIDEHGSFRKGSLRPDTLYRMPLASVHITNLASGISGKSRYVDNEMFPEKR